MNVGSLQLHLERHGPLDSALMKMRDQASAALAFLPQKTVEDLSVKLEEEEDEAMEATTAVALQMAKANEVKLEPFDQIYSLNLNFLNTLLIKCLVSISEIFFW